MESVTSAGRATGRAEKEAGRFSWRVLALSGVLIALFSSSAWANEIEVRAATLKSSTWELTLQFQDRKSVPNACDYTVRRFEYIPALNTLLVDLVAPRKCLIDHYGKRKGVVKWELPQSLRKSARLNLIVNDRNLGTVLMTRDGIALETSFSD